MGVGKVEICIVGAGPRGLSTLERLLANERAAPSCAALTVHVVDPSEPGAGTVWRADQSRHLLMNTVASQITIYTDESTQIDGPIEPGPSLYEWTKTFSDSTELDDATLAEARDLGPDTYPTRAFYGRYLHSCFQNVVVRAPEHVKVVVHQSRVIAMADTLGVFGGPQGVRLDNGVRLNQLDAIVLAVGHVPAHLSPREERTAQLARIHYLTYITPANPADLDLGQIEAGQPVLLRGLGLNFFDHMALFTSGRGGYFAREDGRLVYRASGNEPKLYASSRRGVPYHARGENEKGATGRHHPRLLTPEYIAQLRRRAEEGSRVQFTSELWPVIAKEVESVYYGTLLESWGRGDEKDAIIGKYLALPPDEDPGWLLDSYGITPAHRWDWEKLTNPYGTREFSDREHFTAWLLEYLHDDVRAARAGNLSGPLKAALDVLRDLRNDIRLAVDHGGLEGNSHRDDLEGWYTPLNAFLSVGPPVSRIEEMIALIEAGVLVITGPGTVIRLDTKHRVFIAESELVPGKPIRATVLIEARLPEPDLRRTADPLLRQLLATEQISPYRIESDDGTFHETGGLAVTDRPYHVIDGHGRKHPRRFAYGVPTESVHWVTATGIRPGVDSVTLRDSDAIARAVLALLPVAHVPSEQRRIAEEAELAGVIV
ncbi:FAD/NAD(P)-binding protein [Amycolatopsis sp. cg5]|uniref:FAD/NAD(P)-binding protein n=1 Tax=Amycolatopsis sp. cg5 TaxID=3238802 RepID=UPI003523B381